MENLALASNDVFDILEAGVSYLRSPTNHSIEQVFDIRCKKAKISRTYVESILKESINKLDYT